jgi:hypothetical protein
MIPVGSHGPHGPIGSIIPTFLYVLLSHARTQEFYDFQGLVGSRSPRSRRFFAPDGATVYMVPQTHRFYYPHKDIGSAIPTDP